MTAIVHLKAHNMTTQYSYILKVCYTLLFTLTIASHLTPLVTVLWRDGISTLFIISSTPDLFTFNCIHSLFYSSCDITVNC